MRRAPGGADVACCRDTAMPRRSFPAFVAIVMSCLPQGLHAQFTDPRTYAAGPVGLSQLELDYAHAQSDASVDTALVVGGAHFELNQASLLYTHNFGFLQRLAWVKATAPFARLSGAVAGTNISGSTTGAGDASVQVATLLKGGPALGMDEFETVEPTTTLGVSLAVTVPTGEYNPDKLLNLGSHRWSFRPELAVAHPFGPDRRWEADAYLNVSFFTDNTAYRGVEVLRQEPLPGLEGHISYNFTSSLWASLDLRYSFRGETIVDGVNDHNEQESLTLGSEASWSPDSHNSVTLVFAKAVVHRNAPAYTGGVIKYVYSWGPGDR